MLSNVPHVVSPLGPTWREAVAKDSKLRDFGRDLDLHVHHMGVHPHSIWAQLQPRLTRWLQLGLQLAPSQDGQSWGAARAQAGPNPGQFCGLSATR